MLLRYVSLQKGGVGGGEGGGEWYGVMQLLLEGQCELTLGVSRQGPGACLQE